MKVNQSWFSSGNSFLNFIKFNIRFSKRQGAMLVNLLRRPAFGYSFWKLPLIEETTVCYKAPGDYLKSRACLKITRAAKNESVTGSVFLTPNVSLFSGSSGSYFMKRILMLHSEGIPYHLAPTWIVARFR